MRARPAAVGALGTALALSAALMTSACSGAPASSTAPPSSTAAPPSPTSLPSTSLPSTSGSPPAPTSTTPLPTTPVTVASGLDVPWGLAFLPDGSALVTERDTARVLRVRAGQRPVLVGVVPGVQPAGEGGLLGIAVSPGFATDHLVFVYLTSTDDNRVLRMSLQGNTLRSDKVILTGIPKGVIHNGGRLAFGPDGFLYVTTGESGDGPLAQDRASLGGKILRVTTEGAAAPGNPFPGSPVWSLGHRNVEGLAWDGRGRLYASEFGQEAWDELNLIRPGANYGWPEVEGIAHRAGFVDPLVQWPTDEASPSGIAIGRDGAAYLAALRGESLWRVPLNPDGSAGPPQRLLSGTYGRLRTVMTGADGRLWLVTSNTFRGSPRPGDDKVVILPLAFGG